MLWDVIRKDDAAIIPISELPHLLRRETSVVIVPEPLPAMYMGIEPAFKAVSREIILDSLANYQDSPLVRCKSILEVEPVYLFSADLSWMIALTTENTPDGQRLCVLVRKAP